MKEAFIVKENQTTHIKKMTMLAMFIAMGVVISPLLRVEGCCPMQHFINITCAVFMGPVYAFICAVAIGILRMVFMGIPPLALTGAVFGALLAGILYQLSNQKIIFAVIGEIIGTGIIGSIVSYPVMAYLMGRSGLTWFFYTPLFLLATVIGGSIAFLFLTALERVHLIKKLQMQLER